MLEPTIEDLILAGAIEVAGLDPETGEFLYSFTPEMKTILPEVYNEHLELIQEAVHFFLEEGFLDIDDSGKREDRKMFLTPLAFDEDAISELSEERQQALKEIKTMFEK